MLVLSRKVGGKIYVGDEIVLEIRRIAGNRVTVAIDAPKSVRILRGELKEAAGACRPAAPPQSASVQSASVQTVPTSLAMPVESAETVVVAHRSVDADGALYSI